MHCRVLLLFAHPALHLSRVHSRWLPLAKNIAHVTVHDLYACYPDEFINAKNEQALLNRHDVIIMQFPFYWFSTPGILKNWQDIVLEYGYAFGAEGVALHGKYFGVITSTGGRDYLSQSYRFSMRNYLIPLESMATLCGMKYLPPFVVHDSHRLSMSQLESHCHRYRRYLHTLATVGAYYETWKHAANVNSVLLSAPVGLSEQL